MLGILKKEKRKKKKQEELVEIRWYYIHIIYKYRPRLNIVLKTEYEKENLKIQSRKQI